jgi:uncharacterized membrane protein
MTSLAETEAKASSRGRLLWVALVLSLTLNVFFIGGLVWSRVIADRPPTPAQRFQQIARDLNLTDDQRDAFQQFVLDMRHHTRQLRQNNHPLIDHVWQELGKPQPDQALVGKLIDQATQNRHTYQLEMATALGRFLATLSPEQRAQFIELTQHQPGHGWRLRQLITP